MKVEQEVPNEFLLLFDDGEESKVDVEDAEHVPKKRRERGVYYKNIERKMLLKKKRLNVSAVFLCFKSSHSLLSQSLMRRTWTSGTL